MSDDLARLAERRLRAEKTWAAYLGWATACRRAGDDVPRRLALSGERWLRRVELCRDRDPVGDRSGLRRPWARLLFYRDLEGRRALVSYRAVARRLGEVLEALEGAPAWLGHLRQAVRQNDHGRTSDRKARRDARGAGPATWVCSEPSCRTSIANFGAPPEAPWRPEGWTGDARSARCPRHHVDQVGLRELLRRVEEVARSSSHSRAFVLGVLRRTPRDPRGALPDHMALGVPRPELRRLRGLAERFHVRGLVLTSCAAEACSEEVVRGEGEPLPAGWELDGDRALCRWHAPRRTRTLRAVEEPTVLDRVARVLTDLAIGSGDGRAVDVARWAAELAARDDCPSLEARERRLHGGLVEQAVAEDDASALASALGCPEVTARVVLTTISGEAT